MISRAFAILVFLCLAGPARADLVADWSATALEMSARSGQPLEYQLRAMATVHAAMFEALNYIQGGYRPHFVIRSTGMRGVPAEQAAAVAAHRVLAELYPDQVQPQPPSYGSDDIGADIAAIVGTSMAGVVRAVMFDSFPARGVAPARHDGGVDALGWNGRVAELASARALSPIERARIHALVSMASADAYRFARESGERCAPCIAAPAVNAILESELGTQLALLSARPAGIDRVAGGQIAQNTLARYRPMGGHYSRAD